MKSEIEISVVIPVYKVEAYLRDCVESVLAQTFRQFEIVLVDDGSPDSCPAMNMPPGIPTLRPVR